MTVEIQHVEEQTETTPEIVSDPEDDDKILGEIEERGLYQVKREIVVTEEQYIVRTEDGMGKESRTYWIKQNEDGEWYVKKRRKTPNRGHPTVKKRGDLSTETVREALREKAGIELIN